MHHSSRRVSSRRMASREVWNSPRLAKARQPLVVRVRALQASGKSWPQRPPGLSLDASVCLERLQCRANQGLSPASALCDCAKWILKILEKVAAIPPFVMIGSFVQ